MPCIKRFISAAGSKKLELQFSKSAILNFINATLPADLVDFATQNNIPIITDIHKVFGSPIGNDKTKIANMAIENQKKKDRFFSALPQLRYQAADKLLRGSAVQLMNFVSRTQAHTLITQALRAHDQKVLQAGNSLYGLTNASPAALIQTRLPLRFNGKALRSAEATAPFAWWGNMANSAQDILTVLPGTQANHEFLQHIEAIRAIYIDPLTNVPELLPPPEASALETLEFYASNPDLTLHLQKHLTRSAEAITANLLASDTTGLTTRDKKLPVTLQAKGVNSFLTQLPRALTNCSPTVPSTYTANYKTEFRPLTISPFTVVAVI